MIYQASHRQPLSGNNREEKEVKNLLRELSISVGALGFPNVKLIEKILSIAVMSREYKEVLAVKSYQDRELMWIDGIRQHTSLPIIYLEFGVWEGASIKYIASNMQDDTCEFYGFDSFIGLPEKWDTMTGSKDRGHFSKEGSLPETNDERVEFISGWFQNSVPGFISKLEGKLSKSLVVHYDADLYSSTLFCLMQVDRLKVPYLAIFDEFPGHETRALYNYQQATGAKVKFIGKVGPSKRYPWQVIAVITPLKKFEV